MGFEPMKPFWSLHTFQACAFDHSANSPILSGASSCMSGLGSPNGALNYKKILQTVFIRNIYANQIHYKQRYRTCF
jgi:hypothetical protein